MRFRLVRFINLYLLATLLALVFSGLYGLFWSLNGWLWELHRVSGWLLVAGIPWKVGVSWRSLRRGLRPNFDRGVVVLISLLLALVTVLVLLLGAAWDFRLGPESYPLRQTAISWHWMLALGLLLPLALHVWRRWPGARREDVLSRRGALRLGALAAAGGALWLLARRLDQADPAEQRASGSRLAAEFSGNQFPVTHTVAARPEQVDPQHWQLEVLAMDGGRQAYRYQDLLDRPAEDLLAELDCTLGWYTRQQWQGLPLLDLLPPGVEQNPPLLVRLDSVTGYNRLLLWEEARELLLATHVGGEVLDFLHGYPLRAVVPSRRGWYWVKWLQRVVLLPS